jgi:hypothetical protein
MVDNHLRDRQSFFWVIFLLVLVLITLGGPEVAYAKGGEVEIPVWWIIWPFVQAWSLITFIVFTHPKKLILGVVLLIGGALFPDPTTWEGKI